MFRRFLACFVAIVALSGAAHAAGADAVAQAGAQDEVIAAFDCDTGVAVVDSRTLDRPLNEVELAQAIGLCALKQAEEGGMYCENMSCTGKCKLINLPLACRCR